MTIFTTATMTTANVTEGLAPDNNMTTEQALPYPTRLKCDKHDSSAPENESGTGSRDVVMAGVDAVQHNNDEHSVHVFAH